MPIERTIKKAGGENGEYYTFTVRFHTKHMTEEDSAEIVAKASALMENQEVGPACRKIDIFVKNKQTVAIFRYTGNIRSSNGSPKKKCEEDFEEALEQIAMLVEVFDEPKEA